MTYKLLSFDAAGRPRSGMLVQEHVYDVAEVTGEMRYASVLGILDDWSVANALLHEVAIGLEDGSRTAAGTALAGVRLLAPVLYPGQIFCAGANYVDHIDEMSRSLGVRVPTMKEVGEKPWHFVKTSRGAIVDPGCSVPLPPYSSSVDWELELAAVIGKRAKDVPASAALGYVAGYTIANDLSARDAIKRDKLPPSSPFYYDFLSQKSFDGACPLGPWITPAERIGNVRNLAMKLWLNDELMQDSNTSQMIFDVAEQIEMLSSRVTLFPGDLILTGTPAGVGMGRGRFLRPADQLRLWIEGIGEMRHGVR